MLLGGVGSGVGTRLVLGERRHGLGLAGHLEGGRCLLLALHLLVLHLKHAPRRAGHALRLYLCRLCVLHLRRGGGALGARLLLAALRLGARLFRGRGALLERHDGLQMVAPRLFEIHHLRLRLLQRRYGGFALPLELVRLGARPLRLLLRLFRARAARVGVCARLRRGGERLALGHFELAAHHLGLSQRFVGARQRAMHLLDVLLSHQLGLLGHCACGRHVRLERRHLSLRALRARAQQLAVRQRRRCCCLGLVRLQPRLGNLLIARRHSPLEPSLRLGKLLLHRRARAQVLTQRVALALRLVQQRAVLAGAAVGHRRAVRLPQPRRSRAARGVHSVAVSNVQGKGCRALQGTESGTL